MTSRGCSKPLRGHTKRHVVEVWTVHEMATACPGRCTSARHRVMTCVYEMIYESILTTYVDVMIYESTLENFETAFYGIVFAMVYKSCSAGTDSRILRCADTKSCLRQALTRAFCSVIRSSGRFAEELIKILTEPVYSFTHCLVRFGTHDGQCDGRW